MIDIVRLEAHLNNGKTEYVMCAANHYDDGEDYQFQPYNIETGFIIGGWRHACIGNAYMAANINAKRWDDCTQGFLTTKNRFLNREEAYELVKSNGQLTKPLLGGMLTSEDLW